MGKVGSTSWLTAVKKVFRSPTKSSPKKNCKRREKYTQEDEEDTKKTEKRRWIFRKLTNHNQQEEAGYEKKMESISMEEQKRAIAAAEASTAAAKAAVATAHAAVRFQEIIPAYLAREYYAALIIQTSFRGYLARRALRALKGIVKLQALVRGTNIRKQAKATLKCMQTLIRVQTQLRHQSFSRPLSQGSIRKSMYAETNNLWDKYKHIHQRKSVSGNEEYIEDESKKQSYTIEDIEAMVQTKKQASLHREQALAYALSQQIRRFERKKCSRDEMVEQDKDTEWLSHWLDSKQYIDNNTIDDAIKNVDMESLHPPIMTPPSHLHRSRHHQDPPPYRRQSLHTPRPLHNTRPLGPVQVQSASPRYARTQSAATTPSLRASRSSQSSTTPNYMAATESAKARARTQSTPRQRHSTSDRERVGSSSVKKRLSFPIPEEQYPGRIYTDEYSCCLSQNLRSPSFRSVQEGLYYYYSSNTDFATGEVSPASTSHLRNTRWIG